MVLTRHKSLGSGGGLLAWPLLLAGLLWASRPLQAPVPNPAPTGAFTVGFEQATYEVSPGETFPVRVLISPAPPNGLFSYGVRLLVNETNGVVPQNSSLQPSTPLNFNGVLGAPALKQIQPGSAAIKGTVDFFAVPVVPFSNAFLVTFLVTDRGGDSYPLRLDFFNTLGPTEQIFVDGKGNVLDAQIEFAGALVTHIAGTNKPLLEILTPIILNRQSGLFEQTIRIRNAGTITLKAVRVRFPDVPENVRIYNATGTAGGPYLQYDQSLAPGESVDLKIEYYLRDRNPIAQPTLVAEAVDPAAPPSAEGRVLAVTRGLRLKDGSFLVEFRSLANRTYSIQYSADMVTWKTAVPAIKGTGTEVQWIDNGPPKTEKRPDREAKRFYRVILKP